MDPERFRRIEALFNEAVEIQPIDQTAFLARECGDDSDLRREVNELLQAHHDTARPIGQAIVEHINAAAASAEEAALPLFAPGDLLGERFEVRREIDRGGFGVVYEARDRELGRAVAIKVMSRVLDGSKETMGRFVGAKREAEAVAQLNHPHIVTLYDFGSWQRRPYLVMELLRGETLAARLRRGALSPVEAIDIAAQMLRALEHAHGAGVVHRDLKPQNTFLLAGGVVKILDFGLALARGQDGDPGARAGTPAYMAPEQWHGQPTDARTDLFALGVMLFEMLTGAAARSEAPTRSDGPPQLRGGMPQVGEALAACVDRAMAEDPAARFPDAHAMLDALLEARSGLATSASAPRNSNIARPPTRFVGRASELATVAAAFAGGARLVTIYGPAGSGKTRLAIEHAGQVALPGGAWFCDLTEAREADEIGSVLGGVLRAPPVATPTQALAEVVGQALATRGPTLVVLDNFDQIVRSARDTIGRWLALAPESRFLVTSRELLRLPDEVVLDLAPLEPRSHGVALFVDRAGAARPGYQLSTVEAPLVGEIVEQLDGMPLAIELAAARMRVMSPAQILERLPRRFDLLSEPRSDSGRAREKVGRARNALRLAIDGSWDLLTPVEQDALAQCAVFRGGFSLEAADAVLDVSSHAGAPWVVDVVQSLREKSLLRTYEPPDFAGEVRFGLYESIREYAEEKRRALADPDAATRRHAAHFLSLGSAWAEAAAGASRNHAVARLALERENLLAVVERALAAGNAREALAGLLALDPLFSTRGPYPVFLRLLDAAVAISDGADDALVGRAVCTRGWIERGSGQFARALSDFARALGLARRAGDRRLEGRVLVQTAVTHRLMGRLAEARALLEQALPIVRESGERLEEAIAVGNLGTLLFLEGRRSEARPYTEQALVLMRELGDRRFEGIGVGFVGDVELDDGRLAQARECYQRAVALLAEAGDRRFLGLYTAGLGLLNHVEERFTEAADLFDEALRMLREVGARLFEGIASGHLGALELERGEPEAARARLEQAAALVKPAGDARAQGIILGHLGAALAMLGRIDEARDRFERARELLVSVGDPELLAALEVHLGHLDLALGHRDEAERRLAACAGIGSSQPRLARRMLSRALKDR